MKKIDFHIHTVPTVSDQYFEYDQTVLEKYIAELSLDAIAITNHNTFDKEQYDKICEAVNIPVFPGIEIDIEKGHLLVITTQLDILDFSNCCKNVSQKIQSETDYLTESQFVELFPNVDKYLIIPHVGKSPSLSMEKVPKLISHITCGEVNSIKKFESLKKDQDSFTPVYFSDIRIKKDIDTFPSRYTFVDVDTLSLANIKMALSDKGKVSLSQEEGNSVIQILSNGLKISTGLNVLLGERSSGKTHTLDAIFESTDNAKYIKQFSLVTQDNESDQRKFDELLQTRCSSVSEEHFSEFKGVVDSVKNIHLDMDEKQIEEYL
ncbi:MAG: PHP domain-containing protein, partial [Faecousia sp.]